MAKSKIDFDDIMSIADQRKAGSEPSNEVAAPKIKLVAKPVGKVKKIFRESSSPYSSQQWSYVEEMDDSPIKYDFNIKDDTPEVKSENGWDTQGNKKTLEQMFSEI